MNSFGCLNHFGFASEVKRSSTLQLFLARQISCECCWGYGAAPQHSAAWVSDWKQSHSERLVFSQHEWHAPL